MVMRTFNFDVLVRTSANGNTRTTEGARWLRLARAMARAGTANLVLNSKSFAGYGTSADVGYTRYNYTVSEIG
jgi:hypothetical protein